MMRLILFVLAFTGICSADTLSVSVHAGAESCENRSGRSASCSEESEVFVPGFGSSPVEASAALSLDRSAVSADPLQR